MNKFKYYYKLECTSGFRNNAIYVGRTFGELYCQFTGCRHKPNRKQLESFIGMYDSGKTNAYYHISCVLVMPNGEEKTVYKSEGLSC